MKTYSYLLLKFTPTYTHADARACYRTLHFEEGLVKEVVINLSMLTADCLRHSTLGFLSEFTCLTFPVFRYDRNAAEDFRLSETDAYEAPVFLLRQFSILEHDLVVRDCLRCIPRKNYIVSESLSLLSLPAMKTFGTYIMHLYIYIYIAV